MNFFRATVGVAAKSASTSVVSGSARSRRLCGRDGCATEPRGRHETNLGTGELNGWPWETWGRCGLIKTILWIFWDSEGDVDLEIHHGFGGNCWGISKELSWSILYISSSVPYSPGLHLPSSNIKWGMNGNIFKYCFTRLSFLYISSGIRSNGSIWDLCVIFLATNWNYSLNYWLTHKLLPILSAASSIMLAFCSSK